MSKTYAARLADRIRKTLPSDAEFVITADPPHWKGCIFVRHPSGVNTFIMPWARDKRGAVTGGAVQDALRSIAYQLRPRAHHTETWQVLNQKAYDLWVAQTGIEL